MSPSEGTALYGLEGEALLFQDILGLFEGGVFWFGDIFVLTHSKVSHLRDQVRLIPHEQYWDVQLTVEVESYVLQPRC